MSVISKVVGAVRTAVSTFLAPFTTPIVDIGEIIAAELNQQQKAVQLVKVPARRHGLAPIPDLKRKAAGFQLSLRRAGKEDFASPTAKRACTVNPSMDVVGDSIWMEVERPKPRNSPQPSRRQQLRRRKSPVPEAKPSPKVIPGTVSYALFHELNTIIRAQELAFEQRKAQCMPPPQIPPAVLDTDAKYQTNNPISIHAQQAAIPYELSPVSSEQAITSLGPLSLTDFLDEPSQPEPAHDVDVSPPNITNLADDSHVLPPKDAPTQPLSDDDIFASPSSSPPAAVSSASAGPSSSTKIITTLEVSENMNTFRRGLLDFGAIANDGDE
ncbi:hypothetical protein HDU96_007679 [Phlyctochytrium bullatum]|nr:hypothetical protein HDU96_007679 [Phlyctochytrium bullatum]